jgi:hypothetical protein
VNATRLPRLRALFGLVLLAGASWGMPAAAQVAPLLPAHADADLAARSTHHHARQRWLRQLSVQLAQRPNDANAQLLLGLLNWKQDRLVYLARAHALAPKSAALAWVYAETCDDTQDHCAQRLRPLQRLAPDNAAAWMQELAVIPSRGPARQMPGFVVQRARIIERIAAKPRFDTYRIALIQRLLAALQGAPAYPVESQGSAAFTRWIFASAMQTAWATPPFQGVELACRPRPAGARLRQACYRLGETMALRGDTLTANLIGAGIARTDAPDATARMAAQARQREVLWLLGALRQAGDQPGFPARFLAMWDRDPREIDNARAIIAAAGLRTTPPPGWQPKPPLRG